MDFDACRLGSCTVAEIVIVEYSVGDCISFFPCNPHKPSRALPCLRKAIVGTAENLFLEKLGHHGAAPIVDNQLCAAKVLLVEAGMLMCGNLGLLILFQEVVEQ